MQGGAPGRGGELLAVYPSYPFGMRPGVAIIRNQRIQSPIFDLQGRRNGPRLPLSAPGEFFFLGLCVMLQVPPPRSFLRHKNCYY
jgi:hypothetical protein